MEEENAQQGPVDRIHPKPSNRNMNPDRMPDLPEEPSEEELKEMRLLSNGRWGAAITLLCYVYGNITVTDHLPKDPRQANWMLSKTPLPTLILSLAYVAGVTWIGPILMRNRAPAKGLRHVMMLYNALQVIFNLWIFVEAGRNGWFGSYSLFCEPCNFSSQSKAAVSMMYAAYWYYISKFIDFIDTLFFVVHKKYDHISLLHVSHHALMPVSTWFGLSYQPGGHMTFMGFLNTFVHVVMYLYYLLAAMGPRVRPYLWWKKYITTIQMVQFAAMFFHSLVIIFMDCSVPRAFAQWVGGLACVFQILFADFYIKAYRNGTRFQMCKLDCDFSQRGEGTRYYTVSDPASQPELQSDVSTNESIQETKETWENHSGNHEQIVRNRMNAA